MDTPSPGGSNLTGISKRLVQKILVISENRFQLLMLELHEERERLLLAIWLGIGAAVFALLGGIAVTVVIAIVLWDHSPVIAMLVLAILYLSIAGLFYVRLARLQKNWQTLPATLDQLKKDRECLEKRLV
jgi:uncharacterized membrane protein YqjE